MNATTTDIAQEDALQWREGIRVHGSPERERFVLAHAPLVRYVAQRILSRLPSSVELQDLVNDGLVGLMEAIDRFDPGRGIRFGSFAEARVRGAILDALRERDAASRSLRRKLRELDAATARVEQRLGRAPSDEELSGELRITTQELQRLRSDRECARAVPGDPRIDEASAEAGFPSRSPNPFELVSDAELLARLERLVGELPERERLILSLYYHEGLTLKEIGALLSVTESRVCQIHTKSLRSLGERMGTHAPLLAGTQRRG